MNRYFGLHTLEGEWHSLLPRYLLLAERVVGRRILDIGCGTGIGSSLLLELGAEHVDAIDYRPAVLEVARMKHAKPGLDFHVMFWEELDFDDQSFDMVICLDPSSPVTDRNLLLEMRRVLKPGGEYICAVERKNLLGMESALPRYGYADVGEKIDRDTHHERVPQLGALSSFFETIVSVTQKPHLSYIFDVNPDINATHNPDVPPNDEMRKISTSGESGLWTGPARVSADNGVDELNDGDTPEKSERWITMDRRFCLQSDEANVEILFCGDNYLAPAPVREVSLPYYPLVERLQEMSSALQSRSHGTMLNDDFGPLSDDGIFPDTDAPPSINVFSERASTSEYVNLNDWSDQENTSVSKRQRIYTYDSRSGAPPPYESVLTGPPDYYQPAQANQHQNYSEHAYAPINSDLNEIHSQLAHVGSLYEQVRGQLEDLVFDTRRELAERDRYIAHLVSTVHEWENHFQNNQFSQDSDRESTGIFNKNDIHTPNTRDPQAESQSPASDNYDDEPKTTIFSVSDLDTDHAQKPSPLNELDDLDASDSQEFVANPADIDDASTSDSPKRSSTVLDDQDKNEEEEEEHSL